MQYTPHYNLNLTEGTDIVNPLIQDNPNYAAIDTALYNNKLRVVGTATHTKVGTNHSIVLADSDIPVFRFVATGDYATGDTFSVDGVTVTARVADGSSVPTGAFKINSTVEAVLDGTILNLINVNGTLTAGAISYDNTSSGLAATNVNSAIDELNTSSSDTTTSGGKIFRFGKIRQYSMETTGAGQIDNGTTYNMANEIPSGDRPNGGAGIVLGQVYDSSGNIKGEITGSVLSNGNITYRYTGTSGVYYMKMNSIWIRL